MSHPHKTCKAACSYTVDILVGQKLGGLSSRDFEGVLHLRFCFQTIKCCTPLARGVGSCHHLVELSTPIAWDRARDERRV